MTQRDIVNELNRMIIGYNITWDMIKYDADRAIMKINTYLGAEYPRISEIMLAPHSRYTLKANGKDTPIFPERYLLTVVIPFIATEVLARDEEFTTIYNKYAMDVENGLFDMFQNEYNKVPLMFRQDKDVGVFFSTDIKEHKLQKDKDTQLPVFEINIYYHINTDYVPDKSFVQDLIKYKYNSNIQCMEPGINEFIKGIYHYEFIGWSLSLNDTNTLYKPGYVFNNVKEDIHLYAVWDKTCMLDIDSGELSIKSDYIDKIISLTIPSYVDGKLVKSLTERFLEGATNLKSLYLPNTDLVIKTDSINSTYLQKLVFPPYDYLRDIPNIHIDMDGIIIPNVKYLYIPYSVKYMNSDAISGVTKIQCEVSEQPADWMDDWTDISLNDDDWGVVYG